MWSQTKRNDNLSVVRLWYNLKYIKNTLSNTLSNNGTTTVESGTTYFNGQLSQNAFVNKGIANIDASVNGFIQTGLVKLANYGKDKATKNSFLGQLAGFFGLKNENNECNKLIGL